MSIIYPKPDQESIVDDFFGTPVADPYRWMEDPADPRVTEFITAQNEITYGFLGSIKSRETIKQRLTELFQKPHVPSYGLATRAGDSYFYSFNVGKDQAVVFRREGVDGTSEIVLDPNEFSDDGSIIYMQSMPSPDGKYLAYSISRGGSDWQEFHVRDVATKTDFADELLWCKFTTVVWKADSTGFFYNRFPEVVAGQEKLAENFNSRVYFHKVGTPQSEDVVVFEDPEHPDYLYWTSGSDDNRYLLLSVRKSAVGATGYYYWEIDNPKGFVRLLNDFDSEYEFVGNDGETFYFLTKLDAPRKRIIAVDLHHPARENWREILPEQADTIDAAKLAGGKLYVFYLHNAHSQVKAYSLDGTFIKDIELPPMGAIPSYYLHTSNDENDFLFTFTSFLMPMTLFRYDTQAEAISVFQASGIDVKTDEFETRQIFYPSTDGAQVSMFISHKKGIQLDGNNPTLMYAYGGFDASTLPDFEPAYYLWMEQGGVFAVPNLRGGGEYGEEWHKAGMLDQKQHVFDDMIGGGEWLIANGYTSPSKLAIRGMSNGGLLVATCITQRPDLYGAALCGVPVIDMLRYHKFTAGRLWVSEFGAADNSAEEFAYLFAYSPLNNVKEGVSYPPTLIWTSDGDDRVVPMHSLKFAATVQSAHVGDNPILLRFGINVGHGTVTVNKMIEEESDYLAFLSAHLGWSI